MQSLHKSVDGIETTSRKSKRKYKDFDWREKNRFTNIPKPEHKFEKKDYLAERRNNQSNQSETRTEAKKKINWDSEMKNLDGNEKVTHVKEKARVLEEEARKREQLLKYNNNDQVSGRNEINDMIIDSIKAKIALLDNID